MRVLIGICLVLAVSGYAAAEEAMFDWEMREWTSSDGLPDGYVADLSKDPQGFVWIATYGGLCRFDGKEFVNFSKLRVEEHPDVPVMPTALWKSPTGTIWIGDAEGGIVTYKNGGFEKLVLESEWSKQLIVEFECDQDGNVWVLDSMGNLVRFSDGFYLPVVSYQDGLPTGSSLAKDKASGMLYAAIRGYLWRLSGGEPELVGFPDSEVQGTIETIGPGWKSGIWLFRWDNLMKVEGGTIVEDIHFDADNMGGSPGRLFEYMDGRMGFSTKDKGLFLTSSLDPFESKLISNPNYSSVQCFELDEPGVIWVGYVAEGMACLTEVSYKRLVAPDRWKRRPIKSVNVDKRGDVWVGTEGSGLYHYSQGQWRVYDYTNGLSSDYVWAIGDAPNHELWVGTWGKGVYKIEENGPNRLSFWPDEKPSVTAIEFDDSGGAWIGTSLGLIGVRNDSLAVYDQTTGIRSPNVRTVETTDDGDVWFGMMGGGLGFLSKNGQFRQFDESDGMSDRNVGALYYDHDHSLWVGSYHGGLMRYRDGLFSIIDVDNGLMSNDIASIHEDRTGRLWFSSSEGVFSVEKKELIDCAEGRMDEIAFTLAGAGLGDLKCVSGTKHCADIGPDGTLYYATRDEIVMVRPELQEARNIRIRPVVEGLWMDGVGQLESSSNVDDQHKITVAPGGRRFEFRFSVPSFVSPSSIKCQYLLDGVDPGWLEAGEMRSLVYQNLSPGSYTFQLRAGIRGQKHLTEGESIAFEVLPFWWERISVRIGAVLSLMSILFGGIHWRIASVNREEKRRLEREKALERERMRIARDLHDDLGSSITHISQLSGQPLMGESKESMEVMLHRIRKISSESVRQMDEIVWAVNPRHDSLDSLADYMIQYSQSFLEDAGIACRIDVPFDLPDVQVSAEIRHNFFLICKEALNNIVKHSGAEQVCISLAWVDACIVCSITDNGRGLGQHALGSSSGRISDGNGIRIIRERIRTVGGECSWDASESGGVTFAFRIPVGS